MKKVSLILIFCVILLLSHSMAAIAVGVGGGNQILSYSPNTDQTVKLRLIGCPCTITLDGDLATYAVVNESLMPSVTVTLNYPELGPGEHSVIFSVFLVRIPITKGSRNGRHNLIVFSTDPRKLSRYRIPPPFL